MESLELFSKEMDVIFMESNDIIDFTFDSLFINLYQESGESTDDDSSFTDKIKELVKTVVDKIKELYEKAKAKILKLLSSAKETMSNVTVTYESIERVIDLDLDVESKIGNMKSIESLEDLMNKYESNRDKMLQTKKKKVIIGNVSKQAKEQINTYNSLILSEIAGIKAKIQLYEVQVSKRKYNKKMLNEDIELCKYKLKCLNTVSLNTSKDITAEASNLAKFI